MGAMVAMFGDPTGAGSGSVGLSTWAGPFGALVEAEAGAFVNSVAGSSAGTGASVAAFVGDRVECWASVVGEVGNDCREAGLLVAGRTIVKEIRTALPAVPRPDDREYGVAVMV
jgi:hypothetical protein